LSLLAYAKNLKNNSKYARALQDYQVDDPDLLSFEQDDIIIIKDRYEDGWCVPFAFILFLSLFGLATLICYPVIGTSENAKAERVCSWLRWLKYCWVHPNLNKSSNRTPRPSESACSSTHSTPQHKKWFLKLIYTSQ